MSCDSLHAKKTFHSNIYSQSKQYVHICNHSVQGPNLNQTVQYSTVNKTVIETEGGTKTPLSHNLAGSKPRSEAHRLA